MLYVVASRSQSLQTAACARQLPVARCRPLPPAPVPALQSPASPTAVPEVLNRSCGLSAMFRGLSTLRAAEQKAAPASEKSKALQAYLEAQYGSGGGGSGEGEKKKKKKKKRDAAAGGPGIKILDEDVTGFAAGGGAAGSAKRGPAPQPGMPPSFHDDGDEDEEDGKFSAAADRQDGTPHTGRSASLPPTARLLPAAVAGCHDSPRQAFQRPARHCRLKVPPSPSHTDPFVPSMQHRPPRHPVADQPVVVNAEEAERLKLLAQRERQFFQQREDGSGWAPMEAAGAGAGGRDVSPPRRAARQRHDSPDASPPRRARHDSPDASPPRRQRHDSLDASPPRRRAAAADASPPRRQRHDSPDASPPRRARRDSPDASPPRRQRHDSPDASPPRRQRHDSPDASPPRRARHDSPDASPPRRSQQAADASPPRRKADSRDPSPPRRQRGAADADASPPRKRRGDEAEEESAEAKRRRMMSDGTVAGMVSGGRTRPVKPLPAACIALRSGAAQTVHLSCPCLPMGPAWSVIWHDPAPGHPVLC